MSSNYGSPASSRASVPLPGEFRRKPLPFDAAVADTPCFDEYDLKLRTDFRKSAICGREFYLFPSLRAWLRETPTSHDLSRPVSRLQRLLVEAHMRSPPNKPRWVEEMMRKFEDGQNCRLKVFCILLNLGIGHFFHDISGSIKDDNLPRAADQLDKVFSTFCYRFGISQEDAKGHAARFHKAQFAFCATIIGAERHIDIEEDGIAPICSKTPINDKGGDIADIWRVEIPGDQLAEDIKEYLKPGPNGVYVLALKSFTDWRYWELEKGAFESQEGNDYIVRYIASFSQVQPTSTFSEAPPAPITYSILLELGEADLDDLFHTAPLPFPNTVRDFWDGLFDVAKAVRGIHTVVDSTGTWSGCHGDIKPENILAVDGRFKLADPGFATFDRVPDAATGLLKMGLAGGTTTWGGPERCLDNAAVTQRFDIWSLACVFSVAATWLVVGRDALGVFHEIRRKAIKDSVTQMPGNQRGDCFHDGTAVLSTVTLWHQLLREKISVTDLITARVLDLVDNRMLLADGNARISAKELCLELDLILDASRQTLDNQVPDWVTLFGLSFETHGRDDSEVSKASAERPQSTLSRKTDLRRKATKRPYSSWNLMPHRGRSLSPRHVAATASTVTSHAYTSVSSHTMDEMLSTTMSQPEDPPPTEPEPPEPPETQPVPEEKIPVDETTMDMPAFPPPLLPPLPRASQPESSAPPEPPKRRTFKEFLAEYQKNEWRSSASAMLDKLSRSPKTMDKELAQHVGGRHFEIIVDNGSSMAKHWANVKQLVEAICKGVSPIEGTSMALHSIFNDQQGSSGPAMLRGGPSKYFRKELETRQPGRARTDIMAPLGEAFTNYSRRIHPNEDAPKVTLLILTDGIWDAMSPQKAQIVSNLLIAFVKDITMRLRNQIHRRPFSIQFIQFGGDAAATQMLQHFDDGLAMSCGGVDIVDHEHAAGNFYKMILGSFVGDWDRMRTHLPTTTAVTSPLPPFDPMANAETASLRSVQYAPSFHGGRLPSVFEGVVGGSPGSSTPTSPASPPPATLATMTTTSTPISSTQSSSSSSSQRQQQQQKWPIIEKNGQKYMIVSYGRTHRKVKITEEAQDLNS